MKKRQGGRGSGDECACCSRVCAFVYEHDLISRSFVNVLNDYVEGCIGASDMTLDLG